MKKRGSDLENYLAYQGGSLVSRTALRASVRLLVMNVISGRKCGVLLASLNRDGSWLKMYGDSCQVKMDGSLEEYSGTLPKWGMMSDGELRALPRLEPYIDESEWRLLPTPTASIGNHGLGFNETTEGRYSVQTKIAALQVLGKYLIPQSIELMMGFPIGWTDLNASETP